MKYLVLESDDSRFTKISKTFGMIGIGIACVPGIFLAIPGAIIGGIYAKGKNWRGVQTDNNAYISMNMGAGALIGAGIFLAPCFVIGRCGWSGSWCNS